MASIDLDPPAVAAGGGAAQTKQRVPGAVAGLRSYGLLYG